jgi:hypothetical protein
MSELDIAAIRARHKALFPTEWRVCSQVNSADAKTECYVKFTNGYVAFMRPEEAEFLVSAHQDIPALCDELQTARDRIAVLEEDWENHMKACGDL